jgi:hypothetical protein
MKEGGKNTNYFPLTRILLLKNVPIVHVYLPFVKQIYTHTKVTSDDHVCTIRTYQAEPFPGS